MDAERFDGLVRAFSVETTRRSALGVLAGLGALGLGMPAVGRRKRGNQQRAGREHGGASRGRDDKVTICHRTGSKKHPFQAITVAASAVPAHEAHGDLVACPTCRSSMWRTARRFSARWRRSSVTPVSAWIPKRAPVSAGSVYRVNASAITTLA